MKMVRRTPNGRKVVYTPKEGDIWTDSSTGKTYVFFERSLKWVLFDSVSKENKIKTDIKRTPQEEEEHREILRTIFYTDYEDEF